MSTLDQHDVGSSQPLGSQAPGTGPQPDPGLGWDDRSEFVTARPAGFRVLRAVVAVVILAVIGYVVYTTGRNWLAGQIDPEGDPGAPVAVLVPSGATTADIGSILSEKGIIPNSTFFRYYAQWRDQGNFQAGEYTFAENMSADEAIEVLLGGPRQIEYGEFVIPEGLWVSEMLPRIAQQIEGITEADLQAVLDSGQLTPRYRPPGEDSWEGLLFPAKYFIEDDVTALEVLAKMNDEFARVTGELGYGGAERTHNMSAYEVIIIASLVEAEAKADEDRAKISRVIYNRLRDNHWLGIDATYLYALQDRQAQLTTELLESTENPYYSRRRTGLPPTPIAMPSKASLEAAMNPADGDWIYYVLSPDGRTHNFATTDEEFLEFKRIAEEAGVLDG
ncbi:MAG: endolytic transglycosylase MltG [Acidimicrobiia bacterium]|nr:endolytic transglycosylase MltG [Acidimicrobiia bacterium]